MKRCLTDHSVLARMSTSGTNLRLHNGVEMPLVGFGTFQGSYECDQNVVVKATKEAIDAGYRHIDTAQVYNTETGVGQAIREKIDEGKVTRAELFVTTKLWSHAHRRCDVIPALKKSLQTMGLDYVDLFLVHWPVALKASLDIFFPRDENGELIFADKDIDYVETWQGMEDALEAGLTRAIGISNFNERQIARVLKNCKVKPMNQQIESNPYFNNNQLIQFCQSHGITVTAFSPLGKPGRTWQNNPDDPYVATDKVLISIGEKYGKTPQQIALKFQVQRGVAIIPKSNTPSRIRGNRELFDFTLTEEEMKQIEGLDRNFRILWINFFRPSREYPFTS
ncbi:aldo-keto reductase family 1 member C1-like isoform X1 [Liolophura sinensis]|uniref:aldo-keto reductase family 1 member C1-like isoform X1 n=1 Tax=Liolophura sinensis TaxID=3198878 RepID=UPI0031583C0D